MRKVSMKSSLLRLAIAVAFMLASCASKPSEIGKWRSTGDAGTIEFRKDGTFVIVDNMGSTSLGNYLIDENEGIKLTITRTDILRKNMEPVISPETINAKIFVRENQLELTTISENAPEIEIYKRGN